MTSFYQGKKVLVTGHTGFKGTWLTKILVNAGAEVLGYSRCSERNPSLFALSGIKKSVAHVKGDVRNFAQLHDVFTSFQPEIVFHLAAQPIVRDGYEKPLETYETNVMGTANVLEAVRKTRSVNSVIIVTTDKVYRNNEWVWGYRENDALDGYDPYSNSKSCAELVTASYKRSFATLPPISTVRAGNVIGGGDFAKDRIIPDCLRAVENGEKIVVRNPHAVRPYQHVLEALFAYLLIAERQYENPVFAGEYNIGPDDCDCVSTGKLVELFCRQWGEGASWVCQSDAQAPHEAGLLKLDTAKIKQTFGWRPKWHIDDCMKRVVKFGKISISGDDVSHEMDHEIQQFRALN